MQEIFNFCLENWRLLVSVTSLTISIVICCLRKRPLTDIYTMLGQWCLTAVNLAEKTTYKGQEKLDFAKGIVFKIFSDTYPDLKVSNYEKSIEIIIETILTTPQKKGGS